MKKYVFITDASCDLSELDDIGYVFLRVELLREKCEFKELYNVFRRARRARGARRRPP